MVIRVRFLQIGPLTESRWPLGGARGPQGNNIAIQVTPPDGEEDKFVPALRMRRKRSTPLSALPGITDGLINLPSKTRIFMSFISTYFKLLQHP